MNFQQLAKKYESELFDNVLPFWLEHSQDKECGGYFSCLDRDGSVYDTDKFIWLQGREVWLFSMLCNKVENRPEWLKCARQGGEFLRKYGHDGNYDWYFSLTRDGRPLIEPYNIFSYTFATMAFAQLAKASGDKEYAQIAKRTFDRILEKRDNPKDKWCKAHAGTRPIKDFALPMILCNLALEIEEFIDPQLIDRAVEIALRTIEYGWDKQYGGIFYFMDRLGHPQQQLEWDQKLWWVHLESAIAMLKGYQLTGNRKCLAWFEKLDQYMWSHFKDAEYPEWFGYLNRRGEVLLPLKGGKWKGCFHVPRGLYQLWRILQQCAAQSASDEKQPITAETL